MLDIVEAKQKESSPLYVLQGHSLACQVVLCSIAAIFLELTFTLFLNINSRSCLEIM